MHNKLVEDLNVKTTDEGERKGIASSEIFFHCLVLISRRSWLASGPTGESNGDHCLWYWFRIHNCSSVSTLSIRLSTVQTFRHDIQAQRPIWYTHQNRCAINLKRCFLFQFTTPHQLYIKHLQLNESLYRCIKRLLRRLLETIKKTKLTQQMNTPHAHLANLVNQIVCYGSVKKML